MSRFENWVRPRDVARLGRLLVRQYIAAHKHDPPDEMIIDIDPTHDPCYGHQQLALFHKFYDQRMYYPLLIFDRESGMLLGVRLRAGNAGGGHRVLQVLRPTVRALKEAFPHLKITIRADAGVGGPRLYDYCEQQGLSYLIGIEGYEPLKSHASFNLRRMQERHERTGRPATHYSSVWHKAGTWPVKRRVVYRAQVTSEGRSCRFVVTNRKGLPIHLYRLYCDRGTCETCIDEMKNALWADRLSCGRFVANAFRLLMCALAYNLLQVYRSKLCDTVLAGASIETIRSRLLKVGARVRETARRVWVHMASGFPYREVLGVVLWRIQAMPACAGWRADRPNAPPVAA